LAHARFLVIGAHALAVHGVPERRVEQPVRGQMVPFISRADLIATKRASGRKKDLGDLEQMGES
jgi:hypothetical protein